MKLRELLARASEMHDAWNYEVTVGRGNVSLDDLERDDDRQVISLVNNGGTTDV